MDLANWITLTKTSEISRGVSNKSHKFFDILIILIFFNEFAESLQFLNITFSAEIYRKTIIRKLL